METSETSGEAFGWVELLSSVPAPIWLTVFAAAQLMRWVPVVFGG